MTKAEQERRLMWQYCRLIVEIPIALYLIHVSAREYGWGTTLYWLKYFSINVPLLVALTKKLGWM